jgi:transposase-like protein
VETAVVIVIRSIADAERQLASGTMACPQCGAVLGKWGYARIRTVRGPGASTVTVRPARARCTACATTQVLLPTELQLRRADTTEVIGNALIHKANGLGFRRIAARINRPESTVRRWLRRVPPEHLLWLTTRANRRLIAIAAEVFSSIRYSGDPLGHALTVLAATAFHYKQRFGFDDPPWALIGMYTRGRLLSPPRSP